MVVQKPEPLPRALTALAGTVATKGKAWTLRELASWAGIGRGAYCRMVVGELERAGLAAPLPVSPARQVRTGRAKAPIEPRWRLTRAGLDAVRAATATDSFEHRVWRLFRIRQVLTASEAAECLVDAGGDVQRAERSAVQVLARWHRLAPSIVALAAQQVGGQRRYVLTRDIGPVPPVAPEQGAAS